VVNIFLEIFFKMESTLEAYLCESFETVAKKVLSSVQQMVDDKTYLNIFRDNDLRDGGGVSLIEKVVTHLYCLELFENACWDSEITAPAIILH
jgi:hypothetical protein